MEDGGWRMEDGGWRMEDGGWRMEDGGWRMEDGGWRMEDGGWRMEDGGWRMEDGGAFHPPSSILGRSPRHPPKIRSAFPPQHAGAELDRPLLGPAAAEDELGFQFGGENPAVHGELRQDELQLVGVGVVPHDLVPRHRLQPRPQVRGDVGRDVRVPPVPAGHDVREDPGVGDQFLIQRRGQHADGERHLREGVEQGRVLAQRTPAVVQVPPLMHAGGVDVPVHADHQVEGEVELPAVLGEGAENETLNNRLVDPDIYAGDCLLDRVVGVLQVHLFRVELRRQRDRARPRPLVREVLEQLSHRRAQAVRVADLHPRRLRQPVSHLQGVQLEDEVVGPQAGDVEVRVEPLQSIIELVRQEDPFEVRLGDHLVGPAGVAHRRGGGVVQRLPVLTRQPVAVPVEERPGQLREPAQLHRIVQPLQRRHEVRHQLLRVQRAAFRLDFLFGKAGGAGKFGVVVVAENVGERRAGRRAGVDVGVTVVDRDLFELPEDAVGGGFGGHGPILRSSPVSRDRRERVVVGESATTTRSLRSRLTGPTMRP